MTFKAKNYTNGIFRRYDDALSIYNYIEEKQPNNTVSALRSSGSYTTATHSVNIILLQVVRKRRVAIHKEKNEIKEAIAALNKYLKE